MPNSVATFFMDLVQSTSKFFYSSNYYLEAKQLLPETRQTEGEHNLISPQTDGNWDILLFQINPPGTISEGPRNILEVLLERGAPSLPEPRNEIDDAWFAYHWAVLWRSPTDELIDSYIAGIRRFFNKSANVKANYSKRYTAEDFDKIGEVIYWRNVQDLI